MQEFRHPFRAMGCPCELRLYADSPQSAAQWFQDAEAEIRRLEMRYSRYRDDSVTAAIEQAAGKDGGLEVDAETAALLDYAATAFAQSDGLFDITSGVLRRAWDFKSGCLPEQSQIDALLPLIGWEKLRWDRPRLRLPAGMQLDFGGFVKEYTADAIATRLRGQGCECGLIDLGGDLAVVGAHPDGSPWQIGIRNPRDPEQAIAQVPLPHGAIATSGDYERGMVIDGRVYGHILNPHTGWPVQELSSVSVLADHCVVAGSASTIAMLKGRHGIAWLESLGLPFLCVDQTGRVSGMLE